MLRTIQGTSVPAVGFGTWELVGDDTEPGVSAALELGYRHVDTAQVYGNEEAVGRAIASSGVDRDEVFLTTKIWRDEMTPDLIRRSAERSLGRLGTDRVDLLLIHWPGDPAQVPANVEALAGVMDAGLTRHIGVSNFTPDLLARSLEIAPLFALQVEHHAYLAQPRLLEMCTQHDLLFTAYSPLARSALLTDPVVVRIATERGCTPAQVAMRWILDEAPNTAVIPKATARERIAENLGVLDVELSDADRDDIAELDRGQRLVDPPWAPDWDD
jgi:2,5-diketo-D-gluconate reductase B